MNKLTDLEIFKRIAEILGASEILTTRDGSITAVFGSRTRFDFNPITDGALLNQLIFKYEISISFNFCLISMITDKQYEMNFTDIPSLKRKCLLLIIKAHEEI